MSKSLASRELLASKLAPHGQEHVLRFWDELDAVGREQLARQIESVDLDQIAALYKQGAATHDWVSLARRAEPPQAIRLHDRQQGGVLLDPAEARRRGQQALAAGKIGIVLVAGGQGSRLGFDQPKGMYPIGPISGASLLQIHLEKAVATARRYGVRIPVYMMTSPVTHSEQAAFLGEHGRFGIPADDVILFCQGTMPAVDAETGRLLLAAKGSLFLGPDGHGGLVAALSAAGALAQMRRRGIEHLFYLQVDNPLTPICDAELIGYHLQANSDLTSMTVAKQTPQDRVGNFAMIDGRLYVIEYSDLPEDVAERRDKSGSLVFWAASIAVHVFRVSFLERTLGLGDALPFHIARKKVPYLNEARQIVLPERPNALKFERFIFDLVPHAKNPLIVEYAEEDVFAPLKNAAGEKRDTPEYVKHFMVAQHRRWLEAAGTRVADDVAVEISPLWALDGEAVAARCDRPEAIDKPIYLCDAI